MINQSILESDSVRSVIRTLIYYDVFNYPLTEKELLGSSILMPEDKSLLQHILKVLQENEIVFEMEGFYSLSNDPEKIEVRLEGNKKAEKWMKKARWFSKLISRFPYIRGVSVSGSLSKGFLGEDPDIDYFIITKPNRLWLARTLLVTFKKVFLLNSYKYFCINYFIDSENLEIEEKNLFTATEIITMIPLYGNGIKENFFNRNSWIKDYYPNYSKMTSFPVTDGKPGPGKLFFEFLFDNLFGNWLDSKFMYLTFNHWKRKFENHYSEDEFQLVFKSNKRISKHHPQNFQQKVSIEFQKRKQKLENEKGIDLKEIVFQL